MTKGQNRQLVRRRLRKALKNSDILQISGRTLARSGWGAGYSRAMDTHERKISAENREAE